MTPAQRQYDLELAASMIKMAAWISPRSRKVADVLRVAAGRIQTLASSTEEKIQPASAPEQNR